MNVLEKLYELADAIVRVRTILSELGVVGKLITVEEFEVRQPTVNHKPSKKAKRKTKDVLPDPIGLRSACCSKQVIVRGGDEGTNHYECTSCGDACDIETEESKAAKISNKAKKDECKACKNGGHGRHKSWCPKATGKVVKRQTKKFTCDDCSESWDDYTDISDLKCPACFSKNVWPVTGNSSN